MFEFNSNSILFLNMKAGMFLIWDSRRGFNSRVATAFNNKRGPQMNF